MAVLYEAFSGDASLTTTGWAFDGPPNKRRGVPPINYTLPQLLEAIQDQQQISDTGAFACEPTMVYLVCNQHTYSAETLYDALHATEYASEKAKWLKFLNTTAVRAEPVGPLGEAFFEILYQVQLQELFPSW